MIALGTMSYLNLSEILGCFLSRVLSKNLQRVKGVVIRKLEKTQ